MTVRVEFFIIKSNTPSVQLTTLANCLDELLCAKEKIFILTSNEKAADQLDKDLWTFNDIRFIPHILYDPAQTDVPIHVGFDLLPEDNFNCLINCCDYIPVDLKNFSHIIEWVIPDFRLKKREHYRWYREKNYLLSTRDI